MYAAVCQARPTWTTSTNSTACRFAPRRGLQGQRELHKYRRVPNRWVAYMQNVILLVHLLLTLALIIVVLVQRSEGGGLGMGSGGGNMATGRSATTAMHKVTWALGISLFVTSIALTIIAAQSSTGSSVLDRITDRPAAREEPVPVAPDAGGDLLPPAAGDDAPLIPSAD